MPDPVPLLAAAEPEALRAADPDLVALMERERERQQRMLPLIASENFTSPAVRAALGSVLTNKTTEGFIGRRYHAGCAVIDEVEALAVERAKALFKARYVNVQPHSGSQANHAAIFALVRPGEPILSMRLDHGGHLSHGAPLSIVGEVFTIHHYGVDPGTGLLDMDEVRRLARQVRPKLIIAGTSSYPRVLDFAGFRSIADEVGGLLLADIAHLAGLVAAEAFPSSVPAAHVTTTSTYKTLRGPRGGLIMMGPDFERPVAADGKSMPLWQRIERAVFPGVQSTPYLNNVAAKAVCLREAQTREFRELQHRTVAAARALAAELGARGYRIVTGGTDNHLVLVDFGAAGPSGLVAERALERCDIVVNKNKVPNDPRPATITSGMRLGTPGLASRGMGPEHMTRVAEVLDTALRAVRPRGDREFDLPEVVAARVRTDVADLLAPFPLP